MFQNTSSIRNNRVFSDNREVRHAAINEAWEKFRAFRSNVEGKVWRDYTVDSKGFARNANVVWDEAKNEGMLILDGVLEEGQIRTKIEQRSPFFGQLLSHYGVNRPMANKLIESRKEIHRELFEFMLKTLMVQPFNEPKDGRGRMLRIMEDNGTPEAMAFLSDQFLRLDHGPVFEHAERIAKNFDLVPTTFWGSGGELGMSLVSLDLKEVMNQGRTDNIAFGLDIKNSMTGGYSYCVDPYTFRLVCRNGMIARTMLERFSRRHVGARIDARGHVAITQQETSTIGQIMQKAAERAEEAMDPNMIANMVDRLQESADTVAAVTIHDWRTARANLLTDNKAKEKAAGILSDHLEMSKAESVATLNRWFEEPSGMPGEENEDARPSLWGLTQAATRTARDIRESDPIRASEIEIAAGTLLPMSSDRFETATAKIVRRLIEA